MFACSKRWMLLNSGVSNCNRQSFGISGIGTIMDEISQSSFPDLFVKFLEGNGVEDKR